MKNKVKTEYKLTASNLQRGIIFDDALCYIVCKTINKNTLTEIPSYTNTVYADNNTFIHIEFRINAISYTNYEKVILRFKQYSTTVSNATLKQANDIYLISEGYSKNLHYCTKDDGIYRYVDITSLVANNPNKTVYFAITVNDSYLSLFNENSQDAPVAQVVYHEQSDFYKNQPYLEGNVGSSNFYNLNIRSGQLYFNTNLITKKLRYFHLIYL